jgi:hypothetical protein
MSGKERVRVGVRVRGNGGNIFEIRKHAENNWFFKISEENARNSNVSRNYTFDYAFAGECSQLDVWECLREDIASKVFDDRGHVKYGATIMAYGQTGSGKTYTMLGPDRCKSQPLIEGDVDPDVGIIFRLAQEIFKRFNTCTSEVQYKFTVGMIEIYNEQIKDLLSPKSIDLKIAENKDGIFVRNQNFVDVNCLEDIVIQLSKGYESASVAQTAMNDRSSRAHTIITFKLRSSESGTEHYANIKIVDLAGSEKLSATENVAQNPVRGKTGTRKEGIAINQSLLSLGNMIQSAQTGDPLKIRANSRGSVLTRILLDSIGGNNLAFLLIAVRDDAQYQGEINSSLDFGQRAKKVMNQPKSANKDAMVSQEKYDALRQEKEELRKQKEELERQMEQFRSAGGSANSETYNKEAQEYHMKLMEVLRKMMNVQDSLDVGQVAEENSLQGQLEKFETWMAESEKTKNIFKNRVLRSVFDGFHYRSTLQNLRERLVKPWIKLPKVPILLSEAPLSSGVTVILCVLPRSEYFKTRPLVIGSHCWQDKFKQKAKRVDTLKSHFSILKSICNKEDPDERRQAALNLLVGLANTDINKPLRNLLQSINRGQAGEMSQMASILKNLDDEIKTEAEVLLQLKRKCQEMEGFIGLETVGLKDEHCSIIITEGRESEQNEKKGMPSSSQISVSTRHPEAVSVNGTFLPLNGERILQNGDHIQLHAVDGNTESFFFLMPGYKVSALNSSNVRHGCGDIQKIQPSDWDKDIDTLIANYSKLSTVQKLHPPYLSGHYLHFMISSSAVDSSPEFQQEANRYSLQIFKDIRYQITTQDSQMNWTVGAFPECFAQSVSDKCKPLRMYCERQTNHEFQPGADPWECVMQAVFRTLVFIPIFSLDCKDPKLLPSGTFGELMEFEPRKKDRIDRFLLQIVIANALMESQRSERWLQDIIPAVIGIDHNELGSMLLKLSTDPSLKTNQKAANFLVINGHRISEDLLICSVRENVQKILNHWDSFQLTM